MKEQLLEKIQELYNFYVDYNEIFNQEQDKAKAFKDALGKKGTTLSPEEVEDTVVTQNVDLVLMSQDLQLTYGKLGFYMGLYVEITKEELPAELQEFYNNFKILFPRLSFIIKDGNLMEAEEGSLQKRRQAFIESDFYKQVTQALS